MSTLTSLFQLFDRRGRLLSDLHAECLGLCWVTAHRRNSSSSSNTHLKKVKSILNVLINVLKTQFTRGTFLHLVLICCIVQIPTTEIKSWWSLSNWRKYLPKIKLTPLTKNILVYIFANQNVLVVSIHWLFIGCDHWDRINCEAQVTLWAVLPAVTRRDGERSGRRKGVK